ncbi:MAG: phosphotransferase [Lautropia sp.]|nr:phosphotransferase [Lautropia sp.]
MSQTMDKLPQVLESLRRLGLVAHGEVPKFMPLTGGVSSDILLAEVAGRRFCIKRALPRLKVAALWEAPVERNAAEAAWIRTVAQWLPDSVPDLLGEDPAQGLFAMEFLAPQRYPVWKNELRDGRIEPGFAAEVGARLVQIHRHSANRADLASLFANDATFEPIRIEPYLRATAARHPDLADRLEEIAATTLATRLALVHGDVSPKNILCGPTGPVFLDAECAWYGDPAFDLAFCLNHLLLKGAWKPQWKTRYRACFDRLAHAYLENVSWEPPDAFEARCAALLPGLSLARVDGKSPVEYLVDEPSRERVRQSARRLLEQPVVRLADVADSWSEQRDTQQ